MRSDVPATDVAVYLQALYFRLDDGKFYIPISVVVPGSQIHATDGEGQETKPRSTSSGR